MNDQPEKMTREEIKEFIFDDLVEFIVQTGSTNAVTPEEIAEVLDETPSRVKGCMMQMEQDGVLEKFKEDGTLYFQIEEDTLNHILAEMEEEGWEIPDDSDLDE